MGYGRCRADRIDDVLSQSNAGSLGAASRNAGRRHRRYHDQRRRQSKRSNCSQNARLWAGIERSQHGANLDLPASDKRWRAGCQRTGIALPFPPACLSRSRLFSGLDRLRKNVESDARLFFSAAKSRTSFQLVSAVRAKALTYQPCPDTQRGFSAEICGIPHLAQKSAPDMGHPVAS